VVIVALDDYGWADSWHSPAGSNESQIPTLRELVASGIDLQRHYVFMYCSPSRSALHSGRNPIHINVLNSDLAAVNLADPVAGFAGLPRNITALPALLKTAGYATVQAGKWHLGLATPDHTPRGRGYDQSLSYLDGANDYWTSRTGDWCSGGATDLWGSSAPAYGLNNSWACSQEHQPASCAYEDEIFTNFTVAAIARHDPAVPLFLYFAPHNVHLPLEVPAAQLAKFAFIEPGVADAPRRNYAAMAALADAHVGAVVDALVARGMWNDTLLVLSADNGGPVFGQAAGCALCDGSAGANNWPLRGGKHSNWEGGVRANALISGGLVPPALRGVPVEGFTAIEDWYVTLAGLAGITNTTDERAARAGLPPVEGHDLWPYLSGAAPASPRTEVWLGADSPAGGSAPGGTFVQGLIRADGYKLLVDSLDMDIWTGPVYPNETTAAHPWANTATSCGTPAAPTCLFNVLADPTEHDNVAAAHPDIVAAMAARLRELQAGVFSPDRGKPSPLACKASAEKWGGFVGPFLP